jgi:hypothetical protein
MVALIGSGHWMMFYFWVLALLYPVSAARLRKKKSLFVDSITGSARLPGA